MNVARWITLWIMFSPFIALLVSHVIRKFGQDTPSHDTDPDEALIADWERVFEGQHHGGGNK